MSITALIILDGFGINCEQYGNAIKRANKPNLEGYIKKYPWTKIGASGLDVGLPNGQMGNSEVGHTNIGAGRVVYQELTLISKSIKDGDFFYKPELVQAVLGAKQNNKALHLLGLCSDGGVHSHLEHLYALLKLAKLHGLEKVFIHCFTDGRDVPPDSAKGYIQELEEQIKQIGCGRIATASGRYYAMDRDNRYERVKKAYDAIVNGMGETGNNAVELIEKSYREGVTDEFIKPIVVTENGKPVATIDEGDSVIFFNFRPDRARELTRALIFPDFNGFEREKGFFPLNYVTMTQYDATFCDKVAVAYKPENLTGTMGEYIAKLGKRQLRIAETEKYAHVTFFFNGGREKPFENEDRVLVPSPKVATYDMKPEMSAYEVTEEAVKRVLSNKYDLMVLNFANCDMVGHTGIFDAAVRAVEAVDECVGRLVDAILQVGGRCIITADHGNADCMLEPNGSPMTAHTTNPVPLIVIDGNNLAAKLRDDGRLCDIAPTLLDMMGIPAPSEMKGKSLIIK